MDTTALDQVLRDRVGAGPQAALGPEIIAAEQRRAARDVEGLINKRRGRETEYRAAHGWRIEILAGKEPLWPQGFDPLNVSVLGAGNVLHTRWIKLGNGNGSCEVLGRPSLTEAAGEHPLFQGVRRFLVTGLAKPTVGEKDGKVTIDGEGVTVSFAGRLERSGESLVLRLP